MSKQSLNCNYIASSYSYVISMNNDQEPNTAEPSANKTQEDNDYDSEASFASSGSSSHQKKSLKVKISKRPSKDVDSDYHVENASESSVEVVRKQRSPRAAKKRLRKTPSPTFETESEDGFSDYEETPAKKKASPKKSANAANQKRFSYIGDFKNEKSLTLAQLKKKVEVCESIVLKQKVKLKSLQTDNRKMKKKIEKLEKNLQEEKKKSAEKSPPPKKKGGKEKEENSLTKLGNEILKRASQHSKAEYSEELKNFASLLYFYSPRAYTYVRSVFNTSLPHPSTLRKWIHKEEEDEEKPAEETTNNTENNIEANPDSPPRLNDVVPPDVVPLPPPPPNMHFSDTELTLEAAVDSPPVVPGPSEPSRCTNPFSEVDANLETPKTYMFQTL